MVLARHRYLYLERAGVTRRIKRRMHKRWRREGKVLVRKELAEDASARVQDNTILKRRK